MEHLQLSVNVADLYVFPLAEKELSLLLLNCVFKQSFTKTGEAYMGTCSQIQLNYRTNVNKHGGETV